MPLNNCQKTFELLCLHILPIESRHGPIGHMPLFDIYVTPGHSYYYFMHCKLPLELAQQLYLETKRLGCVRAGGHCCNGPPDDHAEYYHKENGKKLVDISQEPEYLRYVEAGHFPRSWHDRYHWTRPENYATIGRGFVELYHLDYDTGLIYFMDFVNKIKVMQCETMLKKSKNFLEKTENSR